jgi:cyclic pyranopterin phosphate synthase
MGELTHIDRKGRAKMVDVTHKPHTKREAAAIARIKMKPQTMKLIKEAGIEKGDVLQVARVAGIMGAKKTSELIPLCHPLPVTSVALDFELKDEESIIEIRSRVKTLAQTGVEMEALTAVTIAALTVYDMCKAVDKEMTIVDVMLMEKKGGKSGEFKRIT